MCRSAVNDGSCSPWVMCRSAETWGDSGRSGSHQGGADETDAHQGGADETGALRGGADETGALRGGADETGAHRGGADETGAHRGGADETGAHRGGADETGALWGGADKTPGSDWDLEETETQEAERAHIVLRTEAGSLGGHGRSRASGSQDESGDSMGHGGFGVSVSNGGKLPPESSWGTPLPQRGTLDARTSRGILEVLGLGDARKALN